MKLFQLLQVTQMADKLRADGKIYVVVVGLSIILLGILTYLFSIDKKVTKLEKEIKNQGK